MLRFLLDEHLRGPLHSAIVRHNVLGGLPIDAVCVGDETDLPLASDDAAILLWAEREGRIVVTFDVNTMPDHLARHLGSGRHSPGILVVRRGFSVKDVVECLELVAHAGVASDFRDSVVYLP